MRSFHIPYIHCAIALVLCSTLIGCLPASRTASALPANPASTSVLATSEGLASYYADSFEGKRTASGETFYQQDLTAAHRTYPFGTVVRVINLLSSSSVIVRINDRGPAAPSRIIDLSRQAAHELGMERQGVIKVRVEVLEWGK